MNSQSRISWSELGALTSAGTVAATILCCLPFATGIIGAALAAAGARLAPFRLYLGIASLAMLGYAFHHAYRSDPSCAGTQCDAPSSIRIRRAVLWVVTVVVILFLTASWWANWIIYWML